MAASISDGKEYFRDRILSLIREAGCRESLLAEVSTRLEEADSSGREGVTDEAADRVAKGMAEIMDHIDGLQRDVITDPLTGLFNRRYFIEQIELEAEKARRAEECFSLLLMDVDFFKAINDEMGHVEGDRVLRGLGDIFRSKFRRIDIVARYGGEEFAAILPFTNTRTAMVVCERVLTAVRKKKFFPGNDRKVTLSMGISTFYPSRPVMREAMIARADKMLYKAKELGRDRVCYLEDDMRKVSIAVSSEERAGLFDSFNKEEE